MKNLINTFKRYLGRGKPENSTDLREALKKYLGCSCCFFPIESSADELNKAFGEAKDRGKSAGTIPVLLALDARLMEHLLLYFNPLSKDCDFDSDEVVKYRRSMLNQQLRPGKEIFDEKMDTLRKDAEIDDYIMREVMTDELEEGSVYSGFINCWDTWNIDRRRRRAEWIALVEIPVKNPWEVFAFLPFGGWNECPETLELMSVSKYWYEQYGAVLSAMSADELEFIIEAPVSMEAAVRLAKEQYLFCPDIVDQGVGTTGALANSIYRSVYWYFWWD